MPTRRATPAAPAVGIEFREILSGDLRTDGGDKTPFKYDVKVVIADLATFQRAARHVGAVTVGNVTWKDPRNPKGPRTKVAVTPGKFEMFKKDPRVRKKMYFQFDFSFLDANNKKVIAHGQKRLFDDSGFDAAGDLTTVFMELEQDKKVFAKGVVTVKLGGFITQFMSLKAIGGTNKSRGKATSQFFGFMNVHLRQIYKRMPLIFKDDAQLTREEMRTLRFAAKAMLPNPLPKNGPQIDDIVKNLEGFIANASSGRLRAMRFALQQFGLVVPVNEDDIANVRGFMRRELQRPERSLFRDVFVLLHQMVALPYYSHRKADKLVGYVRPNVRAKQDKLELPITRRPPDRVYDAVIAGSGPAGSVLAARLVAQGKSVLVLEAGPYVPEKKIQSDELGAIGKTYKDAGLQRANEQIFTPDPGLFILQGRCVGGGGLINNAVCFMLPKERQAQWRNVGFPISEANLLRAFQTTGAEIKVGPISEKAKHLNPAVQLLEPAFGPVTKPDPMAYPKPGLSECLVNMHRCESFGLCNVGCGAGRKTNALQVHLKAATKGDCTIVPDAEVTDLSLKGGRVEGMHVRLRDGKEVTVRGKQYVLACGPIGSSRVLLRTTGIGRLKLPIGNRLSANVGSPMFAFTRQTHHPRASVQIAHYYWPDSADDGFVIESWYNPPGANSLSMPGFFDEHHFRMLQYARSVGAAPLVGTEANGRVRVDGHGDAEISLPIRKFEIARLRAGLVKLATSFLQGGAHVALAGFADGFEMFSAADVTRFDKELKRLETDATLRYKLTVGTGHPLGGNAMSDDPSIGVVGKDFRVKGVDNLRVCDGSVFPMSAAVNPQWTIMAMAHLCAETMA